MSMVENSEQTIWSGHSSQIENVIPFFICVLLSLTGIGLVISVPYALWRYLVTRSRNYKLTDQRLVITSGVLNKKNEQIELFRIKDIAWEEPLTLRLFSCGRLTIASTDRSDPIAVLNAIAGGEKLVETFRNVVTNLRQKNRVGVVETM